MADKLYKNYLLFSHLSFITNFYHPSAAAIHVSLSEHHSQKLLLFLIIRLILVRPPFTFSITFILLLLSHLSCQKSSLRFELFKSSLFSHLLSSSSPIVQVSRPFCKTFSELNSLDPIKLFCFCCKLSLPDQSSPRIDFR